MPRRWSSTNRQKSFMPRNTRVSSVFKRWRAQHSRWHVYLNSSRHVIIVPFYSRVRNWISDCDPFFWWTSLTISSNNVSMIRITIISLVMCLNGIPRRFDSCWLTIPNWPTRTISMFSRPRSISFYVFIRGRKSCVKPTKNGNVTGRRRSRYSSIELVSFDLTRSSRSVNRQEMSDMWEAAFHCIEDSLVVHVRSDRKCLCLADDRRTDPFGVHHLELSQRENARTIAIRGLQAHAVLLLRAIFFGHLHHQWFNQSCPCLHRLPSGSFAIEMRSALLQFALQSLRWDSRWSTGAVHCYENDLFGSEEFSHSFSSEIFLGSLSIDLSNPIPKSFPAVSARLYIVENELSADHSRHTRTGAETIRFRYSYV